jgi:hypothetical protein
MVFNLTNDNVAGIKADLLGFYGTECVLSGFGFCSTARVLGLLGFCGTVIPSALAILRFTAISIFFVGS